MPATSINEVIARIDGITREAARSGHRRGYFAALYDRVTRRVRDGIARGEFEDNARMERLDVVFANRYLDAFDLYAAGARPTRAWRQALDAANRDGLTVAQHLLLGMNAHINLDLGIAAATVAPGAEIAGLERDFYRINDVLSGLVAEVEAQIIDIVDRFDGALGMGFEAAAVAAGGLERQAVDVFMAAARSGAWEFARDLAALPRDAWAARIDLRDIETEILGEGVLMLEPAVVLFARGGSKDVAGNIAILARGQGI